MVAGAKDTVGLAMVGSGFAARFHAENYRRVYGVGVRFVGVYSRRPEAAAEFAQELGFERSYASMEELLADPDVDLVDTCIPNRFHEEMAVQSLQADKHVVVEKPFAGSFVPGRDPEDWRRCLDEALASADRMIEAERASGKRILYAENLVYAPSVQKANRLLASAGTSILRMVGEESHSGTHSPYAMQWTTSGGGSLYNKGCHSLGAALYLKYEEGLRRLGKRIRPSWVVGIVANLTHSEAFQSESPANIRTGWTDCEDWGALVLGFDDGTVAQISAADIVLGGIQNLLTVYAGAGHDTHRQLSQRRHHGLRPRRGGLRRRVHPGEGGDEGRLALHQPGRGLDQRLPPRDPGLLRGCRNGQGADIGELPGPRRRCRLLRCLPLRRYWKAGRGPDELFRVSNRGGP